MPKSPDAFRTISEVATELDVPQHVLRFWETKFSQIKPLKRAGGRRYYRPADVYLIRGIQTLLYGDGYTIKGVQRILKDQGVRFVVDNGRGLQAGETTATNQASNQRPVDLETGKDELPVSPPRQNPATAKASAQASRDEAPRDHETEGLSAKQRDVMSKVLADLVGLKRQVSDVRAAARDDDDMPLLAKMRAPE